MDDQRKLWRGAAVFGALTFGLATFSTVQGVPDCGAPLPAAMLDFELALTRPEFAVVLDCAPRLAALDVSNIVDLVLFMWVYGGLLTFFALAVGVKRGLAIGLGVLIIGSDFVETAILRQISAAWPTFDGSLVTPLAVAVRVKFVAIAVIMVLAALALWRATPSAGARVTAVLAIVGALGSLAIIHADGRVLGTALVTVGWLAMTVYAAVRAFRSPQPARTSAAA